MGNIDDLVKRESVALKVKEFIMTGKDDLLPLIMKVMEEVELQLSKNTSGQEKKSIVTSVVKQIIAESKLPEVIKMDILRLEKSISSPFIESVINATKNSDKFQGVKKVISSNAFKKIIEFIKKFFQKKL